MNKSDRQLLIEMVMRQTHYKYEEASEKLVACNDNYLTVIRESLGIKREEEKEITSINQGIYTEIRGLMDTASQNHRRQKEREEKKQKILEFLKKQQETEHNYKLETIDEDSNNVLDIAPVKSDEKK